MGRVRKRVSPHAISTMFVSNVKRLRVLKSSNLPSLNRNGKNQEKEFHPVGCMCGTQNQLLIISIPQIDKSDYDGT
ncbi:hypothetical protein AKJ16_DCAP25935 [Drosera capensis]